MQSLFMSGESSKSLARPINLLPIVRIGSGTQRKASVVKDRGNLELMQEECCELRTESDRQNKSLS